MDDYMNGYRLHRWRKSVLAQKMLKKIFVSILLTNLISVTKLSSSLPLSTRSRWMVDEATGERVKLRCGNWPAHLQPMLAEGLEKKPLGYIVKQIASMGFNCVRFTWATYMFTRPDHTNLTVAQSLDNLGLRDAKAGIAKNNPDLLNISVVEAHKAVVNELGANKIMVVLDNHVSLPQWCCDNNDGNGFFGDANFDPQEWIKGLNAVAMQYKNNPAVVAMSIRNELRGPKQNENDWYRYIQEGAAAVHQQNPNVLVIVSGLSYDTDLSFLKKRPLTVNIVNKLVYESHWYSFIDSPQQWMSQTNEMCASKTQDVINNAFFLVMGNNNPVPLFLSEFGVDQRGGNERDNRYLTCLLAIVAEIDIDWALWTLQGSYILRQGKVEVEEVYGTFDFNWAHVRNSSMLKRLQLVKQMNQDPNSEGPTNYIMYHPQSGACVNIDKGKIYVGSCENSGRWNHQGDGSPIKLLKGASSSSSSSGCLQAVGEGLPAVVSSDCSSQGSQWRFASVSKLHIAAQDKQGRNLCLQLNPTDSTILSNKCLCLKDDLTDAPACADNPQSQWFKLVPTNIT